MRQMMRQSQDVCRMMAMVARMQGVVLEHGRHYRTAKRVDMATEVPGIRITMTSLKAGDLTSSANNLLVHSKIEAITEARNLHLMMGSRAFPQIMAAASEM